MYVQLIDFNRIMIKYRSIRLMRMPCSNNYPFLEKTIEVNAAITQSLKILPQTRQRMDYVQWQYRISVSECKEQALIKP